MFGFLRFKGSKCKTQCDLAVSRIRLLRNKRTIRLKASRREIADLLRSGKSESARIRVEAVLRDTAMLGAFDILELHCELLGVRAAVIERVDARADGVPADMVECVSSLAYAAVRVGAELPELPAISAQLRKKFGREWEAEAADDATRAKWHVNEALAKTLAVEVPPAATRLACLQAIASEHGVTWDEKSAAVEMGVDGGDGGGGGVAAAAVAAAAAVPAAATAAFVVPPPAPAGGEFTSASDAAAAARLAADRATAAAEEAERLAGGGKKKAAPPPKKAVTSPPAAPAPAPAAEPAPASASMDEGEGSVNSEPLVAPADEPAPSGGGSGSLGLPSPPENSAGGGAATASGSASLGLPPAPQGGGAGGVVARGCGSSDLDELAKRFESLKKK